MAKYEIHCGCDSSGALYAGGALQLWEGDDESEARREFEEYIEAGRAPNLVRTTDGHYVAPNGEWCAPEPSIY